MSTRKVFDVVIKAQEAALSVLPVRQTKIAKDVYKHIINNVHFPVCLFFFTLEDDQGYYIWLKEPFINEKNLPKLRPSTTLTLSKLDNAALERITSDVSAWYNALFQTLAA